MTHRIPLRSGPARRFSSPLDPTARPLPLRLMFEHEPNPAGTPPQNDPAKPNGFTPDTPWRDLPVEEQVAYWQYNSRKHETESKAKVPKTDLERAERERDELRAQGQTPEQKQAAADLDDARRQGASAERQKWAASTVALQVQLATGRPKEDVDSALEYADVSKFLTATGEVDTVKVAAYAATITPAGEGTPPPATGDPLLGHLSRIPGQHPSRQQAPVSVKTLTDAAIEAEKAKLAAKPKLL